MSADSTDRHEEVWQQLDDARLKVLSANWIGTVGAVASACRSAGREPSEVRIIGVTKYVNASMTASLCKVGCLDLGENRPQVLWKKAEALHEHAREVRPRWHQIGQLQTNKVRRLLKHRPVIHSVDRERLLRVIVDESNSAGLKTRCLLEINISGDPSKTGMTDCEARSLLDQDWGKDVEIIGLMGMAGLGTQKDSGEARRQFGRLRELRDVLVSDSDRELPELSMGMSGDFEAAIAEGATMVRIGSRIFEGLR